MWFSALNSLYVCVLSSWNNSDGNEDEILTGFFLREPAKRDWSSARVFESVALWQSISLHIQSKFFKVFPQQSISLQIHLFTAKWNEFSTGENSSARNGADKYIFQRRGKIFKRKLFRIFKCIFSGYTNMYSQDMKICLMEYIQHKLFRIYPASKALTLGH